LCITLLTTAWNVDLAAVTSTRPNEETIASKPEPAHPPSPATVATGSHYAPPAQIFENEISHDVANSTTKINVLDANPPLNPSANMVNIPPSFGKVNGS